MNETIRLLQGESKLIDAKPDNSIVWYWLCTIGLRYIIATGFAIFVISILASPSHQFSYQVTVILLATVIFFSWATLNRLSYYYLFTNLRIISKSGIINKQQQIVSYDRVADIHVERNWLQRIFGLSSVILEDFSGNRPLVLVGIESTLADRISHTVSSYMYNQK